jgi:hypothetical protein
MNMCLNLNGYRIRAIGVSKYNITVNGNKDRGITYCSFDSGFNLILQ